MGNPENSPPARPASVPSEARYDPKDPGFEWIIGALDEDGRRHGAYRCWTRDGVLHGECNYDHGKVHGKNINFHPDGTIASEADWAHGVIMNSAFYRSDGPTTEPFAQAAPEVWAARYYTRDGKTNYTIRYFLRDGTECGPDGNLLPPRPRGVSADARWFPDISRWVDGEIERGTNKQIGRWRWWSREGVLRHEEVRDPDSGEPTLIAQHEENGALSKRTKKSKKGVERDFFFEDGSLSMRVCVDDRGRETYKASWKRGGELAEERVRVYDGDTLTSVTEKGVAGVLVFEARREGRATSANNGLACVLYHADGKAIAATGAHTGNKLFGVWKLFTEAGALVREVDLGPLKLGHEVSGEGLHWKLGEALYRNDEPTLPLPAQLAGVDAEPWKDTEGCYNECVDEFPRLLRGLVSPDPLVRAYCLGAIDSEIEHQGSSYPATARVVPYLARLLSHPDADHPRLLSMLQAAGDNGCSEAIATAWPDLFAYWNKATHAQRLTILVLAKYAPSATKNILEIARRDPDPGMRACAIDSLTSFEDYSLADAVTCLADKDPLVRAVAAIAIATSKGPETPREVVAAIREAIQRHTDIAGRWADLPYTDAHVLAYLSLAAGSVRSPDARSLAQALCERIDEVDGQSAITYGQGLLALAFGEGQRPFAKRFLEILDTIAASKKFWVFNVNAHEVLAQWNLPREPAELRSLIAAVKASKDPEASLHARMNAKS